MSKSLLVTGGAGFIGSGFVRYIFDRYPDYKVIVLDALTYAGSVENLPVNLNSGDNERLIFWYGNVRNADLVDTLVSQADVVVHFAAETHVARSIYNNAVFFETDVLGTQVVANAVLKHSGRVERFIHISSSEVYGTAQTPLMNEEHPLLPLTPYAAAKVGADRLVYSYWATYGLSAVIVRPFNNYGPRQHLEKAIPRFITSCLLGEPIRVHGDGTASRDFVHVDDLCRAVDAIIHADLKKVKGETFNVGTGTHRSVLSIAQDVVRLTEQDHSLIGFDGDRPGQVIRHSCDFSKIQNLLGWQPRSDWERGLMETIRWYKNNVRWWESRLWMRTVPIVDKDNRKALW